MAETISADVAIYGAGHGGLFAARDLAKKGFDVVLVDPHTFIEHCSTTVRNLVIPSFAERAIVDIAPNAAGARFVQGRLVQLLDNNRGEIELPNQKTQIITAKVVVLCTGTHYKDSVSRASKETTRDERLAFYREYAAKVKQAQSIVIVGGGPVGVELAGEIISEYPDKPLTLVNGSARLLSTSTEKTSNKAQRFMNERKVTTMHNTRVTNVSGKSVTLSDKTELYADLVVWAVGGTPSSEYMRQHFASTLNERGEIIVDDYFRVKGTKNVFAFADVAFLDNEPKLAWLTGEQYPIVANNVSKVLQNSDGLKAYKRHPNDPRMGITLGPSDGVFQVPVVGHIGWAWFARMAKSKDMMTGMFRGELGLK